MLSTPLVSTPLSNSVGCYCFTKARKALFSKETSVAGKKLARRDSLCWEIASVTSQSSIVTCSSWSFPVGPTVRY